MEWFEPACLIIKVPQVIVHEAGKPDMVFDLFDADGLAGKDEAKVDLLAIVADATAGGDGDGLIVKRIVELGALRACSALTGSPCRAPDAGALS